MKATSLATALIVVLFAIVPARAADDVSVERMATCQDSWLDWQKSYPAKLQAFADHLRSDFSQNANDPFAIPKTNKSIAGLRVTQMFPVSLGMGVGFSVTVDATFDRTKAILEKKLGRMLGKCEVGDGMRTCELDIAEKRTLMLMADDSAKSTTTLLGCYYYYEK